MRARARAFFMDYVWMAAYLAALVLAATGFHAAFPGLAAALISGPWSGQALGFLTVTFPITLAFAWQEAAPGQATWGKRKAGLQVATEAGDRPSFFRSLARTALKFVPWELSHAIIWQIQFAPEEDVGGWLWGFSVVWLLVAVYAGSSLADRQGRTLYDRLTKTVVVHHERKDQGRASLSR